MEAAQLFAARPLGRPRRPEVALHPLREALADVVEETTLAWLDADVIEGIAEDLRLVERHRVHHLGLVVCAAVLSSMQRSTDTQGRLLDARRTYEKLGGARSSKNSFRAQLQKSNPLLQLLLRRRMDAMAAASDDVELRGRLRAFRDVLIPDGCAFKLACALSNVYSGTSQPAELKLHAVFSLRTGGVESAKKTAGSVHDSDGFWPERWQSGALYIWDLGYVSNERFVEAATSGAHVLQRLKSGANPVVLASYGPTGHRRELRDDEGRRVRLDDACNFGFVHRQAVLDLDVEITHERRTVVARVVCVPFGGEDRYYLTTLSREIFTPHDVAELYRLRWEIELFFRGWKGAFRLDEVRRLGNPFTLTAFVTASLLAAVLAQRMTNAINELERRALTSAISP